MGRGEHIDCPNGCRDGACIAEVGDVVCVDSDGGINPYKKGYVEMTNDKDFGEDGKKHDVCSEDGKPLQEYYCQSPDDPGSYYYECPTGCKDGACIGRASSIPLPVPEPIPEPKILIHKTKCFVGDKEEIVSGCLLGDSCVPVGYRRDGKYCEFNGEFLVQKKDSVCENNFECSSNVCVSSQCVSEGLLQKILNWFKRLFGVD